MATLSASGTWTGLATDIARFRDTARNPAATLHLAAEDLRTPPDEVRQMVQLAMAGWGAALGTNAQLDFHTTAKMLLVFLNALLTPGMPREGATIGQEV